MTNLDKFNAVYKPLPKKERRPFVDFFIGSLSAKVDDDVWEEALLVAQVCLHPEPDHKCKRTDFMTNGHCKICGESYDGH